ncbi:hypothetical protein M3O96_05980 [Aquiflexum sp. TKW24L]|uniref:hypothetical protein n=1 Tax=Aquiflexum sp. TKW24L TaxID=2942212 RepID=UPI0020C15E19|nr:hypothetical protein [Aquiflexum sp. TKW24L]MCL6258626.1 hypothetical protein [Aquiflexum sp. TKW24L]
MKAFIATMILAASVSVSAMANEAVSEKTAKMVTLRKVDESRVQLIYGLNQAKTVTVKIFDENNFLVQKDKIVSENAFAKYYDFSKLRAGVYYMAVYENNVVMDQLEVDLNETVTSPLVYTKLEKIEGNSYKLLVNALLPSDLSVMVYENDKLVHEERVNNSVGFQKLYRFERLNPSSRVEFFVKSSDGFAELLATK